MDDAAAFNRSAWDSQVEGGQNPWTIPCTAEQVAAARHGDWKIYLTPTKPVPVDWFPETLVGKDVLCLASGGGQQGPLLAAAGANVTVYDNSPRQLARDAEVAQRDGLTIHTLLGDMRDLSALSDASFDLIVHPVSNVFVPNVLPVWRESYRVLRTGGALLAGFDSPFVHCVDTRGDGYFLRFSLPYSDLTSITEAERVERYGANTPMEFGHTLTDQLGGQMAAGFHLVDLFEDIDPNDHLHDFFPQFIATYAVKLK